MLNRRYICLVLFLLCLTGPLFSQDFRITNFHENLTDLSARVADIKDRAENVTALIRVVVRDTTFEFEGNMGIVHSIQKTGEKWLFVPAGTKTLTVRHPKLGVVRDFKIPCKIESQVTYDAEIEILNKIYLQSVYGRVDNQQQDVLLTEPQPEQRHDDSQEVQANTTDNVYIDNSTWQPKAGKKEQRLFEDGFYLGLGINATSLFGPSLSAGIGWGASFIEVGYVYGLKKYENIGFYQKSTNFDNWDEAYDYSHSQVSVRFAHSIEASTSFFVMPQMGVALNIIKGDNLIGDNTSNQFKETYPVSVFLGCRLSLKIVGSIFVQLTPQYNFVVSSDEIYNLIREADSKIRSANEGLSLNAGIVFKF